MKGHSKLIQHLAYITLLLFIEIKFIFGAVTLEKVIVKIMRLVFCDRLPAEQNGKIQLFLSISCCNIVPVPSHPPENFTAIQIDNYESFFNQIKSALNSPNT